MKGPRSQSAIRPDPNSDDAVQNADSLQLRSGMSYRLVGTREMLLLPATDSREVSFQLSGGSQGRTESRVRGIAGQV